MKPQLCVKSVSGQVRVIRLIESYLATSLLSRLVLSTLRAMMLQLGCMTDSGLPGKYLQHFQEPFHILNARRKRLVGQSGFGVAVQKTCIITSP